MMDGLTIEEQEILLGRPVESLLTEEDRGAYCEESGEQEITLNAIRAGRPVSDRSKPAMS